MRVDKFKFSNKNKKKHFKKKIENDRHSAMVDINSFFGNDVDGDSNEKLNKMNQQRFELNALPPPPLNEDDEPIVINVTVQTNNDNDFVNFQLGELRS